MNFSRLSAADREKFRAEDLINPNLELAGITAAPRNHLASSGGHEGLKRLRRRFSRSRSQPSATSATSEGEAGGQRRSRLLWVQSPPGDESTASGADTGPGAAAKVGTNRGNGRIAGRVASTAGGSVGGRPPAASPAGVVVSSESRLDAPADAVVVEMVVNPLRA